MHSDMEVGKKTEQKRMERQKASLTVRRASWTIHIH